MENIMLIFYEGRAMLFAFMVVLLVITYYLTEITKRGKKWNLRRLPAVEAISEGIGRAVELGKSVHFSMGVDRAGPGDPDRTHSYSILKYVATECAKRDCRLITTVGKADIYPILDQIVKESSIEAGKPEWYREEDTRFLGESQSIYAFGQLGIMQRENVGTNFQFGYQRGNIIMLLETANMIGAFQIGGQARYNDELGNFTLICEHSLVLDELVAAGAYLTREPSQIAMVVTQDVLKFIIVSILVVGALLFTANIDVLYKLINM